MFRIMTATASLCLLLNSVNGWAAAPTASKPPVESPEDEAKERLERLAPEGGVREGSLATQSIEILVNGTKKAAFTGSDLDKLQPITAFTPRGGKKSWAVVDVLKNYGVDTGKSVNFYNKKNKKISLAWDELHRQKEKVTFTYNFKGELIVSTDVADRVPEDVRSTDPRDAQTEDQRREQMHKQRQRSLIFFRDVRRVEVVQ
ncbi:MAG: hypothetical protein HY208_00510 [Nitrospirae bacterium]|nr:hypothetical protein [Nitrospirota bacterium]